MTTPTTEILCPECGHPIFSNHSMMNDNAQGYCTGVFGVSCWCKNTQHQATQKLLSETRRAALLEAAVSAVIVPADIYAVIARLLLGTSARAKTPDPIELLKRIIKNSRDVAESDCLYCGCEQGSGPDGNDCYADCPLEVARALIDAAQEQERAQAHEVAK